MNLNKDSISIYEIFEGKEQYFFGIHTLESIYSKEDLFRTSSFGRHSKNLEETCRQINQIKSHLTEHSINPYLILNKLDANVEKEIMELMREKIFPDLFYSQSNFNEIEKENLIKKIKEPSKDRRFMNRLLSYIGEEGKRKFEDSKKAEELFCLYAEKEHIPMILDKFKSISHYQNEHSLHGFQGSIED